jgi:hypothetical protein
MLASRATQLSEIIELVRLQTCYDREGNGTTKPFSIVLEDISVKTGAGYM